MIDPSQTLSNPLVGVALRCALGAYVIYMARRFYADPTGYFRKSMRMLPDVPWLTLLIRGMACFCLWGGCFIVATALAVQIFGLHGELLAVALVMLAALGTWLLLPKLPESGTRGRVDGENQQPLP
jgi:hypothetical protein